MTAPESGEPKPLRDLPGLGAFAGLGLTIAVTIGIFVFLGIWVDDRLHSAPVGLIVGIVVGCVAATASTIALVRRYL